MSESPIVDQAVRMSRRSAEQFVRDRAEEIATGIHPSERERIREQDRLLAVIRREIATAAMQGVLADSCTIAGIDAAARTKGITAPEALATIAVAHADALLAELAKPQDGDQQ